MEIKRFSEFIYEADGDGKLGFFENAKKQIEKLKGRLVGTSNELDRTNQIALKSKVDTLIEKVDKTLQDFEDNNYSSSKRRRMASGLLDEESKLMADIAKAQENKGNEMIQQAEDLDKNLKASFTDIIAANSDFIEALSEYQKTASEKISKKSSELPKFEPIKTGDKDKEKDGTVRKLQTQMMSKNKEIEKFLKEKGAPNGVYGKRTTAVIKAVQKNLGMKEDGILTPEIYSKIMNESISNSPSSLLMFESFLNEKEGKIDWDVVAKEISGYKEESKKPAVSKEKVDKRLELLGEFSDKTVADNLVKVLEMGGLVTKTDKGNPALVYNGITFYKNGRFFNKKWGTKGSFNSEGLKYDKQEKILSWDEFKKGADKSKVDENKINELVKKFVSAMVGEFGEDEDSVYKVFRSLNSKEEFNRFKEVWDSLKFDKLSLKNKGFSGKSIEYIKDKNSKVKYPMDLYDVIEEYFNYEEISKINKYVPNGIKKF